MQRYNPKDIESKWQKKWAETGIYKAEKGSAKPKYYALEFFPYPSGVTMHVGHVRNYVVGDTYSRFKRMGGYNVLHPMGWDAFGLPAENQAIKTGVPPRQSIDENIKIFKRQLMQVGLSYDWSREIDSSRPDYYQWTQWLFLRFFEKGLAYKAEAPVNWCPKDKTVLANEQVTKKDGQNVCERCDTPVEKRQLSQWFFKITDYADRLLDDLETIDWPEGIKAMQRNWIGKSVGAEVEFPVANSEARSKNQEASGQKIKVFTTRPDTLFGATFMVLAPEHPLVSQVTTAEQKATVNAYVKEAQAKSDIERQETEREKTGVFTGSYAINPVNNEQIPIWVADYVLPGYGTGAIMAVPAHDQRDWEFANKFGLPNRQVIAEEFTDLNNPPQEGFRDVKREVVNAIIRHPSEDKYAMLRWSHNNYRTFIFGGIEGNETPEEAARREILEETGYKNIKLARSFGSKFISKFHAAHKSENRTAVVHGVFVELKNLDQESVSKEELLKHTVEWVPFDKVLDGDTGVEPEQLLKMLSDATPPVVMGEGIMIHSVKYDGLSSYAGREKVVADLANKGAAADRVNYKLRDWLISRQRYWGAPIPVVYCEKCGIVAVPDEQLPVVLPELASYQPSDDGRSPLARLPEFVNTVCPQCNGPAKRETDTMDTFVDSSWYLLRFTDPDNDKAPFDSQKANYWMPVDVYVGGAEHAVAHLLFARFWTKFLYDQGMLEHEEPFKRLRNQGMIGGPDGRKMGKRYGNAVTPDEIIEQGYGADALRLFELFIAPYDQGSNWSESGVPGTYRFLQRFWTLTQAFLAAPDAKEGNGNRLEKLMHGTIRKVSTDLEDFSFNTAVAAMMEAVNELYKIKAEAGYASTAAWRWALGVLTQLLAPFAPHVAEELWQQLGQEGSVHTSEWPKWDEKYLQTDTMTIVIQVNGKVRGEIEVPQESSEEHVVIAAKQQPKVVNHLDGKSIKKTIYVPKKLVNFVV